VLSSLFLHNLSQNFYRLRVIIFNFLFWFIYVIHFTSLRIIPNYYVSKKNKQNQKGDSYMESTKVSHQKAENHEPLKGTWISCGVVGGVILITYLIVYGLYMVRV
jgi:hypothetical protein